MKNFYSWLSHEGYGYFDPAKNFIFNFGAYNPPFQVLIGYMIEYLFILGYDSEILYAKKIDNHNIDWYYDYLKSIIEQKQATNGV